MIGVEAFPAFIYTLMVFTVPIHCGACHRAGNGDLGIHFRDISQPFESQRAGIRQFRSLGAGGGDSIVGACIVHQHRAGARLRFFRFYDGVAIAFCVADDAGDKGSIAGGFRETADGKQLILKPSSFIPINSESRGIPELPF